jgi:hypothetical protein
MTGQMIRNQILTLLSQLPTAIKSAAGENEIDETESVGGSTTSTSFAAGAGAIDDEDDAPPNKDMILGWYSRALAF